MTRFGRTFPDDDSGRIELTHSNVICAFLHDMASEFLLSLSPVAPFVGVACDAEMQASPFLSEGGR